MSSVDLDNHPPGWHIVVEQLERARTEASQWRGAALAAETNLASLRSECDALRAELAETKQDAVFALAIDQEQIDELTAERDRLMASVQRESAWVNEAGGVQAHLVGVLHEITRCTTLDNAKTFATTALANIAERHGGLWSPGPHDDAADWKPGHHRERSDVERIERQTTEAIAAWLERELLNDSPAAIKAIAADIRAGHWRTR